ncbi:Purine nucleoside receptor A [Agrobacterium sp. DSM 25558]|uniref:BMP family lipoprotein n=1 Tax=Agrobacterium sp. DSM 25558 TaxID=1907665 RepID=UPI000972594E|nr:BMP family ABC transporter substrate-binding protein [Agrobacterium sp. DSM 25558]SCX30105.1 Purine nucleoside receptor A [Agrobacterium sp. DSM 25558]
MNWNIALLAGTALFTFMSVQGATAEPFKGAVVYGLGGKFDKSFNEGIATGVKRFKTEKKEEVIEFEISTEAQRPQAIERALRAGAQEVIVAGFDMAGAIADAAKKYPDRKFTIIDTVVDAPNVRSVIFREEQGSFLVGAIAGLTSKSGTVGFVGGMDVPAIRRFACGYEQGVKYVRKDAKVLVNMTGTTFAAFRDPTRASALAHSQFDTGADIVYAAAGGSSLGVYQAAQDAHKLAIAVDSNQNFLHPGTILTSMVKRVDEAAYRALNDELQGSWTAGTVVYGLNEDGVSWALDQYNDALVPQGVRDQVVALRQKIISGDIKVHDYVTTMSCDIAK